MGQGQDRGTTPPRLKRPPRNRWAEWEPRVRPLYLKLGNASAVAKELCLPVGTVSRWVVKNKLREERARLMASSATAAEGTLKLLASQVNDLLEKVNQNLAISAGDIDAIAKLSKIVRQLNKDAQVVPNAMKAYSELLEVIGRDDPELRVLITDKYLQPALEVLEQKYSAN